VILEAKPEFQADRVLGRLYIILNGNLVPLSAVVFPRA
jgi:hypothetical protein